MKKLFVFVRKFFSEFWNETEPERKKRQEIEDLCKECQSFRYAARLFSDEQLSDLHQRVFIQKLNEQEPLCTMHPSNLHMSWFPNMIVYASVVENGGFWQKYYDEISAEMERRLMY